MSAIKENIRLLANSMKEDAELVDANILPKKEDGDKPIGIYEKNLPEGLSMDGAKKYHDYNCDFAAAGRLAFSEMSVEAMVSDKNLETVTGEIPMVGKDVFTFKIDRSRTYPDSINKGPDTVKYGVSTAGITMEATKNIGQMNVIKNHIYEMAKEKLKG